MPAREGGRLGPVRPGSQGLGTASALSVETRIPCIPIILRLLQVIDWPPDCSLANHGQNGQSAGRLAAWRLGPGEGSNDRRRQSTGTDGGQGTGGWAVISWQRRLGNPRLRPRRGLLICSPLAAARTSRAIPPGNRSADTRPRTAGTSSTARWGTASTCGTCPDSSPAGRPCTGSAPSHRLGSSSQRGRVSAGRCQRGRRIPMCRRWGRPCRQGSEILRDSL